MNTRSLIGRFAAMTAAAVGAASVLAGGMAGLAIITTVASAQGTFSASTTRPTFDGADQGYFNDPLPSTAGSPGDKWFAEISGAGQTKGQTFTTTQDVLVKAVSYRLANSQATPTKVYIVRIGAVDPVANKFYQLHSEEITQTVDWGVGNTDSYGTWTLNTPVTLPSGAYIGIDIAMKSSTSAWQTGIPYPTYMNSSVFAGGAKYTRPQTGTTGSASDDMQMDSTRDREFHLDMDATTIVDTTAPTLTSIVDQVGGGPIYEDQVQITYVLNFDEAIDATTIDLADFENLGSGVSINSVVSVTQTTPFPVASAIKVVFAISGTGTLKLGVKSTSDIADHYTNPMNRPVADDTTITVNASTNPSGGNRWWDGTIIAGTTDGVSQGGTATWDTTTTNWDRGFGFANPIAWDNASGNTAIFGGAAGTVALAQDITLDGLTVSLPSAAGAGYFIGEAGEDNKLNFSASKTVTVTATGTGTNQDVTIRAGIAGSPTMNIAGRATNSVNNFSLLPGAGVTQTVGTLNMLNTLASNKRLILGGESTGNVVDTVTWSVTGNQLMLTKAGTGTWTITNDLAFGTNRATRLYVEDGTLIVSGTNNSFTHKIGVNSVRESNFTKASGTAKLVIGGILTINDNREWFVIQGGGTLAPGASVGTLTVKWLRNAGEVAKLQFQNGSTYAWEVGAGNTSDVINILKNSTAPVTLDIAATTTLKVVDAGGTPLASDLLTVFTYGAGVTTPDTATLNANMTIDISGTSYTGTPSLVNDGAGTIYLTGLIGAAIPDPGESTVVASPTSVPADGVSTSTITVTLKTAAATAVPNRQVTLANTAGPGMAVIAPAAPVTTDANGVATFTVSSATVGTEEFTATDVTDGGSIVITQTASVAFSIISQTSLIPGYTPPPPPPPDAPQTSLAGTTNPPPPDNQSAPQDTSGDTAGPVDDTVPGVIRVTEYYLTTGDFAGTTATLTLDQDLAADYFILVRGSRDGNGLSMPDSDYARVASVPGGGGGLADAGAADRIGLRRAAAEFDWEGVVTVVECTAPDSPAGFRLVDAVVATLSGTSGSLTCAPWSDATRVVPFGGYRGGGVELPDSPANRYQGTSAYVRLAPSGTNTLDWVRDGGGETLSDAVMTTFVVEWGAGWTVQHAAVAGSAGGDGVDAPEEYTTAAIAPVARANTWVWGTGIRADAGIGDCAESCVVTLGDGVNLNATESAVAVGSEYTDAYSFDVYALTHPALAVDHRFKPDGDLKGLDIPVAVKPAAPGARFAWLYNGCNGTSSRFPRPRMWSRYTADDTVAISRGYDGAEFPAWIQGIDFSGLGHGHTD